MSRIGQAPIAIPAGIQVTVAGGSVSVKGPKGELTQNVDRDIEVVVEENKVLCRRKSEIKLVKAKHGMYRALINNMIIGVSQGYREELELVGVGYRAAVNGQRIELSLGKAHSTVLGMPNIIKASTVTERGKNPLIVLECCDKQLLGQVCAKIRSMRKPEPYKGKGIRFVGEQIRRKAGKSAAKA